MTTTTTANSSSSSSSSSSSTSRSETRKKLLKLLKRCEIFISSLSIIGICICLYALQVEIYKGKDRNYIAYCDLGDYISCSKVFMSKYGKGFGLIPEGSILYQPNSIYGLIYFIIQLILLLFRNSPRALRLKISLSVLANLGNVYLAYILYFILQDLCVVCVSTYVVNFLLLVFNVKHYSYYKQMKELIDSSKKSQ